jgi:hypothetical protein
LWPTSEVIGIMAVVEGEEEMIIEIAEEHHHRVAEEDRTTIDVVVHRQRGDHHRHRQHVVVVVETETGMMIAIDVIVRLHAGDGVVDRDPGRHRFVTVVAVPWNAM